MLVLFAGFVCPRALIPGWWIWVYYINPLAWGKGLRVGVFPGAMPGTCALAAFSV